MVDSDFQTPKPSKVRSSEGTKEVCTFLAVLQKHMQTKVTQNNTLRDAFASSSPPHAFPSSYPPTCHYDPFPCKSGPACFSKPEWRRIPDAKLPVLFSTTIDDLVERFIRLNVRDGTRSKGSPEVQSHAATAAITVIPSLAPHPSLIVRKSPQPTKVVQSRALVRAPVSCPKAFQSPSPTSKPVTLVHPSVSSKNELLGKRKTAPLPRRFPGRMLGTRRDTTPSESSSSSSSSPRLFSMESESRSCSLPSFSSLSIPSDAAIVQELSHLLGPPCRSLFDSPIRGLGDIAAISPSLVS